MNIKILLLISMACMNNTLWPAAENQKGATSLVPAGHTLTRANAMTAQQKQVLLAQKGPVATNSVIPSIEEHLVWYAENVKRNKHLSSEHMAFFKKDTLRPIFLKMLEQTVNARQFSDVPSDQAQKKKWLEAHINILIGSGKI